MSGYIALRKGLRVLVDERTSGAGWGVVKSFDQWTVIVVADLDGVARMFGRSQIVRSEDAP